MSKSSIVVLFLVISGAISLSVKELDDIFGDVECIEGELMLQNAVDSQEARNAGKVQLVKTQDVNMAPKTEAAASFLTEIQQITEADKNALNRINELAQFNKVSIEFLLVDETGDALDKTFRVRLNLGDEVHQSTGRKIKDAKRNAAARALESTKYSHPPAKSPQEIERSVQKLTPTVHLNNIASKLGIKVAYVNEGTQNVFIDQSDKYLYYSLDSSKRRLSERNDTLTMMAPNVDEHGGPFRVRVDVGDESFVGTGWTRQSARHDAAEQALDKFRRMSLQDADQCLASGQLCNKLNVKSPVSLLHEVAARHNWEIAFEIVDESGPPHKRLFRTRCRMADLAAEAEGKSKKEAKRKAAEAMLKLVEDVKPWELINVRSSESQRKNKKNRKKNKITRPGGLQQVAMNVLDAFSADFQMADDSDTSSSDRPQSPRSELLNLGRDIGVGVRFASYQDNDRCGSLVSLDTEPGYHCYSTEATQQDAEDNAALSALKFLKHVGLNNILIPLDDPQGKKVIIFDEGTLRPSAHHSPHHAKQS